MMYLWLQILFSLLAAAIVGGLVAYWWIKRRYDDVTEIYESTINKSQASATGLTREDLNASLTSLKSSVSSIEMPDVKPLHARLGVIENRLNEPVNEMRGLTQRMNEIDGALAMLKLSISELRNTDLNPMETQIASLSRLVESAPQPDLGPILNRLQHMEEAIGRLHIPDTDLGPIHSGLAQLELAIAGIDMPQTDVQPVRDDIAALDSRLNILQQRMSDDSSPQIDALASELSGMHTSLASLTTSVGSIGTTDLGPLHERLSQLEQSLEILAPQPVDFGIITQRLDILRSEVNAPDSSMDGLHTHLSNIENMVDRIDTGGLHTHLSNIENMVGGIDIGSLFRRMEALDASLTSLRTSVQTGPDFGPLEQRIAGLHDTVRNMPEPDMTPVINSVHAIEGRLDLGALENRMTSIEYGLAALHHTLRTRSDSNGETRRTTTTTYRDTDQTTKTELPSPPPAPVWETPERDEYSRTERNYTRSDRAPRIEREPRPDRQPRSDRQPRGERTYRTEREPRDYQSRDYQSRSRQRSGDRDTLRSARRPGDKANLLTRAAFGQADELERISGVGPMLHDLLTGIGVYYFWQIAEWGPDEIEWVDNMLDGFNGRIERDNWVGQARIFADEPETANRP